MRPKTAAVTAVSLLLACSAGLAQPQAPATKPAAEHARAAPAAESAAAAPSTALQALSLSEALALAERADPALRAQQARLAAAEGARADAAAPLYHNPELTLEQARRSAPVAPGDRDRFGEWSGGVAQTFEIAGQQGYRRDATSAALAALRLQIDTARRELRADVAQRYGRVLALQKRSALEAEALALFERTAAAVDKRRAAGEDTRLDANVATVEAERARNQLALADEQLLAARAELAARLQLQPGTLPQATGELTADPVPYSLDDLLQTAAAQPRLSALGKREQSAAARLRLEQASVYPDVTVGLRTGREGPSGARERLTTLSVTLPLPLFRRNGAGIGQARTDLSQARIERQAAERDVRADVHALWARLASLQARIARLQDSVLPTLDDNRRLALKSQQAGQIGLLELIVVSRQSLDARRDLIEALGVYQGARAALEAAAGWPLTEGKQP